MNQYKEYAAHINANEHIIKWLNSTAKNHLEKNVEETETVQHILDYMVAVDRKVERMSFVQAKKLAEAWTKAQQKKGKNIKELPEDTETVLDFKDGYKVVKLIGEKAYRREGYLMSHCVGYYFGKSVEVYSLRDKNNMPHCTMERDQQIKGKGNGDIAPKYIDYVVQFLEYLDMTVGDSEMKHLGYINIESILNDVSDSTKALLYKDKYFPKDKREQLLNKDSKTFNHLGMLDFFSLIEIQNDTLKVMWDIPLLTSGSIKWIRSKTKTLLGKRKSVDNKIESGGNRSQLAGGNRSQLAGGNDSQLAGGNDSQLAGGYDSQLAGGNYSQLAGGNRSQLAGGNCSQLALEKNGIAVGDHNSQVKGDIGSVLVLVERNNDRTVKAYKAEVVDGKKIKVNTWYKLDDGEFVEVN